MTTRDEFLQKLNDARRQVAPAFQTKYVSFFFGPTGKLDRGVGLTLMEIALMAAYVFLPNTWLILLTVGIFSCILFMLVPWKPLVLRVLGNFPSQEKK
jgi:hypothetical protein